MGRAATRTAPAITWPFVWGVPRPGSCSASLVPLRWFHCIGSIALRLGAWAASCSCGNEQVRELGSPRPRPDSEATTLGAHWL